MLTLFAVPKPFRGHIGVIQTNALRSWVNLRPACEIMLFGDEHGIAEAAARFGVRHIPEVARNEFGTPLLDDVFSKAQELAAHDTLCYINADLIIMGDFMKAIETVRKSKKVFLLTGRRWNIDVEGAVDFSHSAWENQLRGYVLQTGRPTSPAWIDYFVFPRGFCNDLLPFALGRAAFDNWLLWKARSLKAPLIDVSQVVMAVHQNHDYSHHPQGQRGVWEGPEAERNRELMGGWHHCFTLVDATHHLKDNGLESNLSAERWIRGMIRRWHWLIERTLPLRKPLGLCKPNKDRF